MNREVNVQIDLTGAHKHFYTLFFFSKGFAYMKEIRCLAIHGISAEPLLTRGSNINHL